MAMEFRGNVIVLDDGTGYAADLLDRVKPVFPNIYRLSARPTAGQGEHQIPVKRSQLNVKTLVRAMSEVHAYWGIIPKDRDPLVVITDYLSAARPLLEQGFPAFVVVAAERGKRYRRIAIVADTRVPITTGAMALVGVAAAWRSGATLDVLLLGADPDDPPRSWDEARPLFRVQPGAEYLEQALDKAREVGVQVNWVALGDQGPRATMVLEAVREGGYDLVLDDLPSIDVGPRVGRLKRVQRQLELGGSVATTYRLLRDAPCDVGMVVDAVERTLVTDRATKVGAVAALSLGMMSAANAPIFDGASDAAAMVATVEAPADPATEAVAQAAATVAVTPAASTATTPAPPIEELPGTVSRDQLAQYQASQAQQAAQLQAEQHHLAALKQQQADAERAVALAQADLALERADASAAVATVDSAADRLDYAEGRSDDLTEAEEKRALGSLNRAERDVQRQQADVHEAEDALAQARSAATAAADAVTAQQAVVHSASQNVAGWAEFVGHADARTPKASSPVPGVGISTPYGIAGPYWSSGYHTGTDFAAPTGTRVVAAESGVVTATGWNGAYGNQVTVQHEDGTRTAYAHLSSIGVSVGQSVQGGQQIGTVGSTGNSTGPHLHFEVLDAGGGFMNPETWLRSKGAI